MNTNSRKMIDLSIKCMKLGEVLSRNDLFITSTGGGSPRQYAILKHVGDHGGVANVSPFMPYKELMKYMDGMFCMSDLLRD